MCSKSFRTQPTEAHRQNHFKAVVFVSKTGGKGSLPQTGPIFEHGFGVFRTTPATCRNSSDAGIHGVWMKIPSWRWSSSIIV